MSTVFVMVGLPGSGKSTYAKELSRRTGAIIISSDELRKTENLNGKVVFRRMRELLKENVEKGYDVILDATNVTVKRRLSFVSKEFSGNSYKVAVVMNKPIQVCLEQNKQRPKEEVVPDIGIYSLLKKFVYPTLDEGFNKIMEVV